MPQHDQLHRYLFENFAVRGELVTVSETLQQILENHTYPQPVKTVLSELLVATSLLTATLKFAGDITVQLQGDGPLSLAVINGNNNQQMRGVARVQGDVPENADLKTWSATAIWSLPLRRKKVNAIRAWLGWKAIPWRPARKITSCAPSSCQPACIFVPATLTEKPLRAVCCCR